MIVLTVLDLALVTAIADAMLLPGYYGAYLTGCVVTD